MTIEELINEISSLNYIDRSVIKKYSDLLIKTKYGYESGVYEGRIYRFIEVSNKPFYNLYVSRVIKEPSSYKKLSLITLGKEFKRIDGMARCIKLVMDIHENSYNNICIVDTHGDKSVKQLVNKLHRLNYIYPRTEDYLKDKYSRTWYINPDIVSIVGEIKKLESDVYDFNELIPEAYKYKEILRYLRNWTKLCIIDKDLYPSYLKIRYNEEYKSLTGRTYNKVCSMKRIDRMLKYAIEYDVSCSISSITYYLNNDKICINYDNNNLMDLYNEIVIKIKNKYNINIDREVIKYYCQLYLFSKDNMYIPYYEEIHEVLGNSIESRTEIFIIESFIYSMAQALIYLDYGIPCSLVYDAFCFTKDNFIDKSDWISVIEYSINNWDNIDVWKDISERCCKLIESMDVPINSIPWYNYLPVDTDDRDLINEYQLKRVNVLSIYLSDHYDEYIKLSDDKKAIVKKWLHEGYSYKQSISNIQY